MNGRLHVDFPTRPRITLITPSSGLKLCNIIGNIYLKGKPHGNLPTPSIITRPDNLKLASIIGKPHVDVPTNSKSQSSSHCQASNCAFPPSHSNCGLDRRDDGLADPLGLGLLSQRFEVIVLHHVRQRHFELMSDEETSGTAARITRQYPSLKKASRRQTICTVKTWPVRESAKNVPRMPSMTKGHV